MSRIVVFSPDLSIAASYPDLECLSKITLAKLAETLDVDMSSVPQRCLAY